MKENQIICIVGPSCAGKTTAAGFLQKKGFTVIQASKYPRTRHAKSKSKLSLLEYVRQEFEAKGLDTFAKQLVGDMRDQIERSIAKNYVIDGFRAREELDLVSHTIGPCRVIAIFADSRTRYARNIARNSSTAIGDYSRFVLKDLVEYSFGVSELMASAGNLIINEDELGAFENNVLSITGSPLASD